MSPVDNSAMNTKKKNIVLQWLAGNGNLQINIIVSHQCACEHDLSVKTRFHKKHIANVTFEGVGQYVT